MKFTNYVSVIALSGAFCVACGGGGGADAVSPDGEAIKTGDGKVVSAAAASAFNQGLKAMEKHDNANDWNDGVCNSVAESFEKADDELRVELDGDRWMIGTPVKVALPSDSPQRVVAVPRDALILRADNTYVFKVADDGTAERVPVETGAGTSVFIAVEGDVTEGDRVIVRGGERLRPGQTVAVGEEGTTAGG